LTQIYNQINKEKLEKDEEKEEIKNNKLKQKILVLKPNIEKNRDD